MYRDEIVDLPYTHPEWNLAANVGEVTLLECVPYLVVGAWDTLAFPRPGISFGIEIRREW